MDRFVLISNQIKDHELKEAGLIKDELLSINKSALVDVLEMNDIAKNKDTLKAAQCIIALGGDGTMIRVAKDSMFSGTPIIGVNMGNVGFLAEIELSNVHSALKSLINDEYHIEERMLLEGALVENDIPGEFRQAVNEVVISRRGALQVVGYRVFVNGMYLNDFYGDGIIVSTPTGSTGYNMSAGGPIVEPKASLIVLTPVCTHSVGSRSIMLSGSDVVEIMLLPSRGIKEPEVAAYFDGGETTFLKSGDRVCIRRSSNVIKLCSLSDKSFLEVLHKKMTE